ncbi:dihydrolipoamide acyltransferase [Actinomadura sp. LD22]|uniref:Dihydrolipoamide acyltransferase n=1 Tax=Actinomadura physcomitrii TaxID=2650748 RepID=A0A6I4MMY5_9ACTN|nr:lipoyl domain-containing protein [Actinomadura physcomitrii]MWA04861.1 dihydrolipoamide acyltransferase [Actinomadura physcomitrii]
MSKVEVRIPKLGMSMQEGHLVEFLVPEGGRVEAEAPLYVLDTDKVEQEIPAPSAGTVHWIAEPETDYEVGALVAEITADGS